jgi:pimeloyl-ACP methyl ester carboxylesterase
MECVTDSSSLRTARVCGIDLRYDDVGVGPPNIILLHGTFGTPRVWTPLMPRLTETCRVIAPALRGHAGSTKQGPYHIDQYSDDLVALLETLKIDSCVLVGHSAGGGVATLAAAKAPSIVKGLVVASMNAFIPDEAKPRIAGAVEKIKKGEHTMQAHHAWLRGIMFAPRTHRENPTVISFHELAVERDLVIEDLAMVLPDYASGFDIRPWVSRVKCPVMSLVGAEDRQVNHRDQLEAARLLRATDVRIVKDAGHLLPLESPDEFVRAVIEFATRVSA